jgi:hypothetical protein
MVDVLTAPGSSEFQAGPTEVVTEPYGQFTTVGAQEVMVNVLVWYTVVSGCGGGRVS